MNQLHARFHFVPNHRILGSVNCEVGQVVVAGGMSTTTETLVTKIFSYVKTQTALDEIIETHSRAFLGSVKLSEQESVDWRCEVVAERGEGGLQLRPVDTAGLVPDGGKVWSGRAGIFHFLLVERLEAVLPVDDVSPQRPELAV